MRFVALLTLTMTALAAHSHGAAPALTGVWRLVEVNSLPMQDTPPQGQLNRKEVYTPEGDVLVGPPDAPASALEPIGKYQVRDGVRTFTSPEGESVETPIQWMDADHFFFEFSPGERWYYARVLGDHARDAQWEPRSVLVVRTTEDGNGPTLRDFAYDLTDDTTLPWAKRIVGAWETIRVGGRGVSGPDTPPYGMPNDRCLLGADGTIRRVHADGTAEDGEQAVHYTFEKNQLTLVEAGVVINVWFNHWGQLVFEESGMQTTFKRVSLDPNKAAPGPIVIVLLARERQDPVLTNGKLVEVKKGGVAKVTSPFPGASAATAGKSTKTAAPKKTFSQPFNGGSMARDLALADNDDALKPENAINQRASKDRLGSTSEVLETNEDDKLSLIRADAIDSDMEVPFGWHIADNGDRMLVFDDNHFIEIALEKNPAPKGPKALLEEILQAQRETQPDVPARLNENGGDSYLLMMNNVEVKGQTQTRAYLTKDIGAGKELLLVEIVCVAQPDLIRGLNLSEALTRNLKHKP